MVDKLLIPDADLSAYKVLIVDDISLNLILVKKMLSRYSFAIVTATNGQEALDMIESERPALVLLDLMMPIMDGYEVISRVKRNPKYSSLRIVVLSALNTNDDVVKALNLGADEFLTKPITLEKLYTCVNKQFDMIRAMEADAKG